MIPAKDKQHRFEYLSAGQSMIALCGKPVTFKQGNTPEQEGTIDSIAMSGKADEYAFNVVYVGKQGSLLMATIWLDYSNGVPTSTAYLRIEASDELTYVVTKAGSLPKNFSS